VRSLGVGDRVHVEARVTQAQSKQLLDRRFVLDDQNRSA
jgi:hypothetical protein